MLTVNFYSFSKKANSTAQPSGNPAASFECLLKEPCSIINPRLVINNGTSWNPASLNYCYISTFNRYYYCSWSFARGVWEASCSVDVLASYKSQIGSSSLYIVRSSSSYDGSIVDDMYPVTADVTEHRNLVHMTKSVTGSYVLGVFGANGGESGMINLYSLNDAQFATLKDYLFNDDVYDPNTSILAALASEIGENLSKSVINPMQYIAFCTWFPYPTNYGTTVTEIPCGYFKIPVGGTLITGISATALTNAGTATLSKHPKTASKGKYLNLYPYSRYCLFMHPYGAIDIDTSLIVDESSLVLNEWIDYISGIGVLTVSRNSGGEIAHRCAQVGVNVPLSQSGIDVLSMVGSVASAAMAAGAGDPVGYFAAVGSAMKSINGNSMTMGTASGKAGFYIAPYVVSYHYDITDENLPEHGRPLMQIRTINTLSGYIEVDHGDVDTGGTAEETLRVKSYLESGFYYE